MDFNVGYGSWGSVTFKLIPTDSVLTIDRSGSMGASPCTSPGYNEVGCKIHEARVAANNFVDVLVNGSNITKVGYTPYTDCFNPPLTGGGAGCVGAMALTPANCDTPPAASQVTCLNVDPTYAHLKINGTTPNGNTNICYGLYEALQILDGPGTQRADPKAKRFAVLLTDGDNNWNASNYNAGQNAPPNACRPASPTTNDAGNGTCSNSAPGQHERDLDVKTAQQAALMKSLTEGVEIYVVGLSVCNASGTVQSSAACDNIGDAANDTVADQRLLKCIASSTPGTNDHYFFTSDATQLGDIFQTVAYEIASRGLTVIPPP
jgi:hypothetical protein